MSAFEDNIVLIIFGFYLLIIMVANYMFGQLGFVGGIIGVIALWKYYGEAYVAQVKSAPPVTPPPQ